MSDEMSDEEFIRYCETHSRTERAGFVPEHLARILRLAGNVERAAAWEQQPLRIVSVSEDVMDPLCKEALKRLSELPETQPAQA